MFAVDLRVLESAREPRVRSIEEDQAIHHARGIASGLPRGTSRSRRSTTMTAVATRAIETAIAAASEMVRKVELQRAASSHRDP